MSKATHVKVGGTWKNVINVWTKAGGTWKPATIPYVNAGGTWKECISYYDPVVYVATMFSATSSTVDLFSYDTDGNELGHKTFSYSGYFSLVANDAGECLFYNAATNNLEIYDKTLTLLGTVGQARTVDIADLTLLTQSGYSAWDYVAAQQGLWKRNDVLHDFGDLGSYSAYKSIYNKSEDRIYMHVRHPDSNDAWIRSYEFTSDIAWSLKMSSEVDTQYGWNLKPMTIDANGDCYLQTDNTRTKMFKTSATINPPIQLDWGPSETMNLGGIIGLRNGNIVIANNAGEMIVFNTTGVEQYRGTLPVVADVRGSSAYKTAFYCDAEDNIYVVQDTLLVKYNVNLVEQWRKTLGVIINNRTSMSVSKGEIGMWGI